MAGTVGFVGLGTMGAYMAANLMSGGVDLAVFSRRPEQARDWAGRGAKVAGTLAELAGITDLIVTCVTDHPALESVLDGLLADGWAGGLLVDCSTIAPDQARASAARVSAAGGSMVDAPVTGGDVGARDGTLTIMCGGSEADVERARPVLALMGKRIEYMGPLGAGQVTKACNQIMVTINLMGALEASALARSGGVDPARMREVLLSGSGASVALDRVLPRRFADGPPSFRLELMLKDISLATATARAAGVVHPGAQTVAMLLQAAVNRGLGGQDFAALGALYDALNPPAK